MDDATFDVFVSYAHEDSAQIRPLAHALEACGLEVWLDEPAIDDFASITGAIERGLARSKALVAYYSAAYPARRACQWELTAAFLAAQRHGDPRERVLVVNPEREAEHVEPLELRDALFVKASGAEATEVAGRIAKHVRGLDQRLGDLDPLMPPPWYGERGVGSARFVGRIADMWTIHSALQSGQLGAMTGERGMGLAQLRGLGGMGKSLLAAEYAMRFGAAYPSGVFWLRAYGRDDARGELSPEERAAERDLQVRLFALELGVAVADRPPDEITAALAHTLRTRGQPFLWVVDDLPSELSREELNSWLGPGPFARTLMTTRSRGYAAIGKAIDLGVLPEQDAMQLLALHRKPDGDAEERAARAVAQELGYHAQALDVTGAALRAEVGLRTFEDYRGALQALDEDELELAAALADALPNGHERSIAATLARSVDRLDGPGLDFLRLAAQLAPEPIPARLVAAVFTHADGLGAESARRRAAQGLRACETLSLAELVEEEEGSRQVHTLVSRTVRFKDRLDPQRAQTLRAGGVAALMREVSPELDAEGRATIPVSSISHARQLVTFPRAEPEADLLEAIAELDHGRGDQRSAARLLRDIYEARRRLAGDEDPKTLAVVDKLGYLLGELGDLSASQRLLEQALGARRQTLGGEDPATLRTLGALAVTLTRRGDFAGARARLEQAIEIQRRVLGDEHPDTVGSLSNLAAVLHELGDLEGARARYERVLDIYSGRLDDDHPATLGALSNLAIVLEQQRDFDGARARHERALAGRRRLFGDEHPATLASLTNLANTLSAQGDHNGARSHQERALEMSRRVLGAEHPDTLRLLNNVGVTRADQGDLAGARLVHEEALTVARQAHGDEHPLTLTALTSLAETIARQGDLVGARANLEQALEARRRISGDMHPSTLEQLEGVLAEMGDVDAAQALFEQLRSTLGDDHPDTLRSLSALAAAQGVSGDYVEARATSERALAGLRRVSGNDDPHTLTALHRLAISLGALDKLAAARAAHQNAFEGRRRVLGEDHEDTLMSLTYTGMALGAEGDLAGARQRLEHVLEARRGVLGDEHPDTLESLTNLATILGAAGEMAEAGVYLEEALAVRQRVLGDDHPDTISTRELLELTAEPSGRLRRLSARIRRRR